MISGKHLELSILPIPRNSQMRLFFFKFLFIILNINIPLYFKFTEYRGYVTKYCDTCLLTAVRELSSPWKEALCPRAVYWESPDSVVAEDPMMHCPLVGESGHRRPFIPTKWILPFKYK